MRQKKFSRKVLEIVSKIKRGHLLTYAEVAQKAGSPRACRAVGNILRQNFRERAWQLPLKSFEPVPCHRVIRSDGFIGGYADGVEKKEKLLKNEGHKIENHKIATTKINSTQYKLKLKKK